jgi:D-alanyl-lipoteichoic acid acyltransferase DltB (MBOAT superfamily)
VKTFVSDLRQVGGFLRVLYMWMITFVIVLVSLCLFSAFNTDKMNNHESLEYSSSGTLIGENGKPNNLKAKKPKQDSYNRLWSHERREL